MTLEWLRRHDPVLDRHLRTYLFTTAPIVEVEVAAEAESESGGAAAGGDTAEMTGSLGIGGLKGATP
jgi:hypothetical protein